MLLDQFNRTHNYLRISLTDRCNFRCSYCMPDGNYSCLAGKMLMSADEIERLARIFVGLGITKIRLTGGEPLIRPDFSDILRRLSALPVELALSTNGVFIHKHITQIRQAGIRSVNVSLDTLRPQVFKRITGRDEFNRVWENIHLLQENNIMVKLNAVAMSGVIEDDLLNFIRLTKKDPLHIRFIEYMPFNKKWESRYVIPATRLLELASEEFDLIRLKDEPNATAKKYKVIGHEGSIAFITTMSSQFCGDCNRIRLTSDGKIKNCLFGKEELDLLGALRAGEHVETLIRSAVRNKFAAMGGQFEKGYQHIQAAEVMSRSMVSTGG